MAAAKMKNVQAPPLKGKNVTPSSTMPPTCTRQRGLSSKNIPQYRTRNIAAPRPSNNHMLEADMIYDGLNEKETEIEHPEQWTPSVILVPEHRTERPQFPGPSSAG